MATSPRPRSRMEATETDVYGRLFRIKKTCARVRLFGLENEEARVDIAILRRVLGIGINDLRDVLHRNRNAHVHVDLVPMRQAPRFFQRGSAPWNVVNIRLANGEPVDKASTIFANPASYFIGRRNMLIPFERSKPLIKPEMIGVVIRAIWKIFADMDVEGIDVCDLLQKLKAQFSKTELPALHSESKSLSQRFRRFLMTIPLYFTLRWGKEEGSTMVFLHPGFVEADIQKELRRRALLLFRRRRRRRRRHRSGSGGQRNNRGRSPSGSETSGHDTTYEDDDVEQSMRAAPTTSSGRIPVINESAKCAVVVSTLLKDAAKAGMLVISLDCKGVQRGDDDMKLTLVQLSTLEGEIWLFDIVEVEGKTSLMKEGHLGELLEADCIMKVMHDCRDNATHLFRQFGVKLCNVFDTTLAYETLLNQCNLFPVERGADKAPIGLMALGELMGEKAGPPGGEADDMEEVLKNNPHMWEQRPLSENLIQYAARSVKALVPGVFNKLDRLIHPAWQQYFDWVCEDTLHKAHTPSAPAASAVAAAAAADVATTTVTPVAVAVE